MQRFFNYSTEVTIKTATFKNLHHSELSMLTRLMQPQEIEVYYIIPTLRRYFAQVLKERKLKQKEIARLLSVEESTVSQYCNAKRASKIIFSQEIGEKIRESTSRMQTPIDTIRETQFLLKYICSSGELCRIHKQLTDIPRDCNLQVMGCHV